ncbi:carbamoyltransferase HypF [Paraferrimonas sedimenticola]|uniref:Carbamoyltransferase HypF n=1 Tax=Paraferrimonas sedimenticola TaxID=375674 RepID=A0AA37VZK1_9GAMM|nr:carbamoyltransferase HypF [Paraferrimonas sedimenticola]GLP97299.1 carbamoyltransferase HypF [Paraferrimonas sedimenticola]
MGKLIRQKITLTGTVQGVGFRPFVFRCADKLGLTGSVLNDASGVTIEAQGTPSALDALQHDLMHSLPPLAMVDSRATHPLAIKPGESEFTIVKSRDESAHQVAIASDQASCKECLADVSDPNSRFFRYPFTNCTNCGPRYTIIRDLPYDRPNTVMSKFEMCPECLRAYQDPLNRRYHAQPISCPNCGPKLIWRDGEGKAQECQQEQCIARARQLLLDGKVLALKGLGGYHLMCDATNPQAVARLRQRKHRPAKPLAVMVSNRAQAESLVSGDPEEWQMLTSQLRPIVIMKARDSSVLAKQVAPDIDRVGVFLPYTPLHQLLLDAVDRPLVATSANRSGEPVIHKLSQLMSKLEGIFDGVLDHNRPIENPCDDSVVQVVNGQPQWWRVARGLAPLYHALEQPLERPILAVGAHQKNRLSVAFGNRIVHSPHIGDLDNLETLGYFERTLTQVESAYQIKPQALVRDWHPQYLSSQWAQDYSQTHDASLYQVQHHHAHVLAVMAEHKYSTSVLGFAFDGTGLGESNQLWGGEVLVADVDSFERRYHLKPVRLIGSEKAIQQPYRVALAMLFEYLPLNTVLAQGWAQHFGQSETQVAQLHQVWQAGINAPYSNSMGRLFDAMASFAGVCQQSQFDGQAGMRLEAAASACSTEQGERLSLSIKEDGLLDSSDLMARLIELGPNQIDAAKLARGFIENLANTMASIAALHPKLPLVFSGGVMQNRTLLAALHRALGEHRQRWLWPENTPVNDSCIAQGQLWYAIHRETTHGAIANDN